MKKELSALPTKCRIPNCKRLECLSFFESGLGYKKTARLTGLNVYTVRDYLRRYKAGDISWASGKKAE